MDYRNREINFRGDALYFWCYSGEGIAAADLPFIRLEDTGRNFSGPQSLGKFVERIPEKKWIQVRIPLRELTTGSIHQFEPNRTAKMIFGQGTADSKEHTLIVDEIKIEDSAAAAAAGAQTLPAPRNVSAKGYERHIDIAWIAVSSPDLERYVIYRSTDGRDFEPIGIQVPGVNRYTDYVGKPGLTARYKIAASTVNIYQQIASHN